MFTRPTLIRESVYDHLRDAILNGEFQPAERLGEVELTERLGVSRTPIREAIGRLTQDGLLESTPGRGVRIRVVSAHEAQSAYVVRETLDGLAAALAATAHTDADAGALADALTRVSPPGLVFKRGLALQMHDPSIAKVIDGARYAVGFPRKALDAIGGEGRLRAEVERVLAAPEIKVIRRFDKGLAKSVDVKKFLRGLEVGGARGAAYLEEAQVLGDFVPLLADVEIMGDGGVKIAEVIEALFPATGAARRGSAAAFEPSAENIPYHAVRAELGRAHDGEFVTPLDLAKVFELMPPKPPRAKGSESSLEVAGS